ncbi:MAG TPA: hypothetical protein VF606_09925, partial [Geminicoccaceae bacterium]
MSRASISLKVCRLPVLLGVSTVVTATPRPSYAQPAAMPQGPVAYVGHGAMFDRDDNGLTLTAEFIGRTQDF